MPNHKIKGYQEFCHYYMPTLYQKYLDKLYSVKLETIENLFLCMRVSFEYKATQRSTIFKLNQKVIKENKIIGKVRKRKRKVKTLIQEVRTDRPPTGSEIKQKKYSRHQTVTTKVFTHINETIVEDFIDPIPTLEVISTKTIDLDEDVTTEVPVYDIEFVNSIMTEEEIPISVVVSDDMKELKEINNGLNDQIKALSSNVEYLRANIEELKNIIKGKDRCITVLQESQARYRSKLALIYRPFKIDQVKLEIYRRVCKCNITFTNGVIENKVDKDIQKEMEYNKINEYEI
jgi:D-ribose pyranose/furanose isomerase RbsD/uncharacterized coiled-coil protein SlyX